MPDFVPVRATLDQPLWVRVRLDTVDAIAGGSVFVKDSTGAEMRRDDPGFPARLAELEHKRTDSESARARLINRFQHAPALWPPDVSGVRTNR